jgi:hypothetical protein
MIPTKPIFLILAAAMTSAVAAQTSAPPPAASGQPAGAPTAKPPKPKQVCQTMQTGSLIPKRVCMSPEEWAEFQRRNGLTADEIGRTTSTRCTMGGIC